MSNRAARYAPAGRSVFVFYFDGRGTPRPSWVKAALPAGLNRSTKGLQYASEADLLNIAVFGRTAKEWREQNPNTAGNQRDHASPAQLHVLANLEMLNAYLLKKQMAKDERAHLLLQEADYQFGLLFSVDALKR